MPKKISDAIISVDEVEYLRSRLLVARVAPVKQLSAAHPEVPVGLTEFKVEHSGNLTVTTERQTLSGQNYYVTACKVLEPSSVKGKGYEIMARFFLNEEKLATLVACVFGLVSPQQEEDDLQKFCQSVFHFATTGEVPHENH